VWPVGCDGQCGTLLFVDSDGEPEPDALYFCSEACRMWYESPDPEPAEGVDGAQGERRVLPLDGAMVDVPF
jgi:hypothetical protein